MRDSASLDIPATVKVITVEALGLELDTSAFYAYVPRLNFSTKSHLEHLHLDIRVVSPVHAHMIIDQLGDVLKSSQVNRKTLELSIRALAVTREGSIYPFIWNRSLVGRLRLALLVTPTPTVVSMSLNINLLVVMFDSLPASLKTLHLDYVLFDWKGCAVHLIIEGVKKGRWSDLTGKRVRLSSLVVRTRDPHSRMTDTCHELMDVCSAKGIEVSLRPFLEGALFPALPSEEDCYGLPQCVFFSVIQLPA